jgi:hypothetical protein
LYFNQRREAILAVKRKEHEKLDDANVERVAALLEQEKPISITKACEELNIANNGARLKKIIAEFRERKEIEKQRRAANRGKPATEFEVSTIAEDYLSGENLKAIADRLYRSTDFVKRVIEEVGVPQASSGENYSNYSPLPEQCVAESFEVGKYVWASKYGAIAEVTRDCGPSSDGLSKVYQIYVHEQVDPEKMRIDGKHYQIHSRNDGQLRTTGGFYAHQCAYELGSLEHLRKHGVDVKRAIK